MHPFLTHHFGPELCYMSLPKSVTSKGNKLTLIILDLLRLILGNDGGNVNIPPKLGFCHNRRWSIALWGVNQLPAQPRNWNTQSMVRTDLSWATHKPFNIC